MKKIIKLLIVSLIAYGCNQNNPTPTNNVSILGLWDLQTWTAKYGEEFTYDSISNSFLLDTTIQSNYVLFPNHPNVYKYTWEFTNDSIIELSYGFNGYIGGDNFFIYEINGVYYSADHISLSSVNYGPHVTIYVDQLTNNILNLTVKMVAGEFPSKAVSYWEYEFTR